MAIYSWLFCSLLTLHYAFVFCGEITSFADISSCKPNEYFNSVSMKCTLCNHQKGLIPTSDKLSCTCGPHHKIVLWDGAGFPTCERCLPSYSPSSDGLDCIPCAKKSEISSETSESCLRCSESEIRVERYLNGSLVKSFSCEQCVSNTTPSDDQHRCVQCLFLPLRNSCSCPMSTHEFIGKKFCVPQTALTDWPDDRGSYLIEYESGLKIDSLLLRQNLRLAIYQCKLRNHTACQAVANMCVMVMFREGYRGSPCNVFLDTKHIPTSVSSHLPWLFYGEGDAQTVLSRKKIPSMYSLDPSSKDNKLNLTIARFAASGRYMGLAPATLDVLHLCPGSWGDINFGINYKHECLIPVRNFITGKKQVEFFEPYLQYWEKGESHLHALPILTLNIKDGNRHPNKEVDKSGWQLVRRFFLMDAESGTGSVPDGGSKLSPDNESAHPHIIRYAKSLYLKVKVQNGEERGRVYPPLLVVEYSEITADEMRSDSFVSIRFSITFEMENNIAHAIEVSIIVFSVFSLVWAGIQTLSYSRRAGQIGFDLVSLLRLCILACGRLSDSFFIVVAGAAIHTFLFYKGQSVVHILLPGPQEESIIFTYVTVAFVLKAVDIACMIYHQVTVDIFLMDWERARASANLPRPQPAGFAGSPNQMTAAHDLPRVSIWRTYFVANEWNEIQTLRKTSLALQLLMVLLFLKVMKWEEWALSGPAVVGSVGSAMPNLVCRFALAVLVYIGVYALQWLFMTTLYERFVKNFIQDFVDVCSIANVSVFILAFENFGYYIHGRSVHGFADTDMQTMLGQLQREEDDLVGHRGLLPATEQQTFQMMIPSQLRACYRKVMAPMTISMGPSTKRLSTITGQRKPLGSTVNRSVQAYHSMNKLLAAFFEHALKDLDYEVRSKLFLESVLDMEFAQVQDKGILYIDNGHSFDDVIFYGNEWTLLTFDLVLFSFMDMLYGDFLLAAIVTGLAAKALVTIRQFGGRSNLAKKTLIDERFLI